jgi:hypothetical protein
MSGYEDGLAPLPANSTLDTIEVMSRKAYGRFENRHAGLKWRVNP